MLAGEQFKCDGLGKCILNWFLICWPHKQMGNWSLAWLSCVFVHICAAFRFLMQPKQQLPYHPIAVCKHLIRRRKH